MDECGRKYPINLGVTESRAASLRVAIKGVPQEVIQHF